MNWDVIPLANLCRKICDGTHFTPRYVPHGVPFYSVENVTADDFANTKFISEAEHTLLVKRCKPERGDILMTRITAGVLGDTRLIDWDVNASIYVSLALLKPNAKVVPEYLYCYSKSRTFRKDVEKRALINATPKKINMGDIGAVPIPVPKTREEQLAIATALNDLDALLRGLDRLIAKKRDLKQAVMQQLLSGQTRLAGFQGEWEAKRLGSLGSTYGGLTGKTKGDFGDGEGRYVTFMGVMANIVIDSAGFERVRVTPAESQNRVVRGDLLFNGSSETPEEVGMCSLMTQDVPNLFLNSFCFGFRLRDDTRVDGLFLAYYIRSREGREMMKALAQGSTRYNLSKGALLDATILLPLKDEQIAIATVLSDMDAELSALKSRRDKTRDLKEAMMQELLTGRTRLV